MLPPATPATVTDAALGPLESRVMEIVWRSGEANVREVVARLSEPLA